MLKQTKRKGKRSNAQFKLMRRLFTFFFVYWYIFAFSLIRKCRFCVVYCMFSLPLLQAMLAETNKREWPFVVAVVGLAYCKTSVVYAWLCSFEGRKKNTINIFNGISIEKVLLFCLLFLLLEGITGNFVLK